MTKAVVKTAKSIHSRIGRKLARLGKAANSSALTGVSRLSAITARSRVHLNAVNNSPATRSAIA